MDQGGGGGNSEKIPSGWYRYEDLTSQFCAPFSDLRFFVPE